MTNRVNIKTNEETRERLQDVKRDGETWDGLLKRAADAIKRDERREQYPGAPRCTECHAISHVWTVEGGMLVCGECVDVEIELGQTS